MTSKTPKIIAGGLLLVLLVGILFLVIGRERGRRAVAAFKANLVAAGEKLSVGELAPVLSVDAQTAGNALVQAAWRLKEDPRFRNEAPVLMRRTTSTTARVLWRQPECSDGFTNSWSALAENLERHREPLAAFRLALAAPASGFPLDYRQGFNLSLPHLTQMRPIAQQLSLATVHHLRRGELTEAQASLNALLALIEVIRDEPLLFSQLVRLAIAQIGYATTWEALQAQGWNEEQLQALQSRWEGIHALPGLQRAFRMERAIGIDLFAQLRRSPALRQQVLGGAFLGTPAVTPSPTNPADISDVPRYLVDWSLRTAAASRPFVQEQIWAWQWSYRDELHYLKGVGDALNHSSQLANGIPYLHAHRDFTNSPARTAETSEGNRADRQVTDQILPSLHATFRRCVRLETQQVLLSTAIATKRFQLRHGRLPARLADLTPEFVRGIPKDPMDGQPLRYRRLPPRDFLLYSIGSDGVDDGGNSEPPGERGKPSGPPEGRDIVWPAPAPDANPPASDSN